MNKAAIGREVPTNREHIIVLEPMDKGLMGTPLRYPYEVHAFALRLPLRVQKAEENRGAARRYVKRCWAR
ncbi:non-homologous end joining protein Ku [Bradyrhizobium sp. RT5a]